jgi:hypothetical protein
MTRTKAPGITALNSESSKHLAKAVRPIRHRLTSSTVIGGSALEASLAAAEEAVTAFRGATLTGGLILAEEAAVCLETAGAAEEAGALCFLAGGASAGADRGLARLPAATTEGREGLKC